MPAMKRRGGAGSARILTGVVAVSLAVIVPTAVVVSRNSAREQATAKYRRWAVQGPPCAEQDGVAAGAFKTVVMEEVGFSRLSGHAACVVLNEDEGRGGRTFPACQFTSPGLVRVETSAGVKTFDPGPGRPATVYARRAGVQCVVGANEGLFQAGGDRAFGG